MPAASTTDGNTPSGGARIPSWYRERVRRRNLLYSLSADRRRWLPREWDPKDFSDELKQQLRNAVAQEGDLGRLRQVLGKLHRGESLEIAVLGSSVVSDFGGAIGYMQDRHALAYTGVPAKCHAACVQFGWLLPVFRFLTRGKGERADGPLNETASSSILNCGVAAERITKYLDCTANLIPLTADLILVDGANGMSPPYGNLFKPTERILRRLLSLPKQPAVVMIHWFNWCGCVRNTDTCQPMPRINRHLNGSCYNADGLQQSWNVGKVHEETFWGPFTKFYQLPVLSMRRAFHPFARVSNRASHQTVEHEEGPLALRDWHKYTWDGLHPLPCDNNDWKKCRYSLLIASVLNQFLIDVQNGRRGGSAGPPRELDCRSISGDGRLEPKVQSERCFGWDNGRWHAPKVMHNSGWRQTSLDTATSFDPPPYCKASTVAASETVGARCPKEKPGFTSFTPGSVAVLELPLDWTRVNASTEVADSRPRQGSLTMRYLTSYEGMGVAVVRCEGSCSCESTRVDGQASRSNSRSHPTADRFLSVWKTVGLDLLARGGTSKPCELWVELQNASTSRATKFKWGAMSLKWLLSNGNHEKTPTKAMANTRASAVCA